MCERERASERKVAMTITSTAIIFLLFVPSFYSWCVISVTHLCAIAIMHMLIFYLDLHVLYVCVCLCICGRAKTLTANCLLISTGQHLFVMSMLRHKPTWN